MEVYYYIWPAADFDNDGKLSQDEWMMIAEYYPDLADYDAEEEWERMSPNGETTIEDVCAAWFESTAVCMINEHWEDLATYA